MIKGEYSLDGALIVGLGRWSRKKIIKICDECGKELIVTFQDLQTSREKRNKDACHPCSMKLYNKGEGNPAKRFEVRQKISKNTRGRSKKFKDGKNPRIINKKVNSQGYVEIYSDVEKNIKKNIIMF